MFNLNIFVFIGLFLSQALYADYPSEFSGTTQQDSYEWSVQMSKKAGKDPTLEDLYSYYSYTSASSMATDFAQQLCLDNYNYYAEVGMHAFEYDGLGKSFSRNSLLDALFKNTTFLNELNECLKIHDKSIEAVVIKALAASQVTRALSLLGFGVGISATVKLFNSASKVLIKKITPEITHLSSAANSSALKEVGIFAAKTTPIVAGMTGFYMFDSVFKSLETRHLLQSSYPDLNSERARCFYTAREYELKKQEIETTYKTKKQELTNPDMLEQLESEYAILKIILQEELDQKKTYFKSCSTL